MKIAVTSQNYRTVTPHAGKTRRWIVFEVTDGAEPVEVDRLDLPRDMSLHEWKGRDDSHPLYQMQALVVGTCGAGFVQRMGARGVRVSATSESDPAAAVRAFLATGAMAVSLDDFLAAALQAAEDHPDHHHH